MCSHLNRYPMYPVLLFFAVASVAQNAKHSPPKYGTCIASGPTNNKPIELKRTLQTPPTCQLRPTGPLPPPRPPKHPKHPRHHHHHRPPPHEGNRNTTCHAGCHPRLCPYWRRAFVHSCRPPPGPSTLPIVPHFYPPGKLFPRSCAATIINKETPRPPITTNRLPPMKSTRERVTIRQKEKGMVPWPRSVRIPCCCTSTIDLREGVRHFFNTTPTSKSHEED